MFFTYSTNDWQLKTYNRLGSKLALSFADVAWYWQLRHCFTSEQMLLLGALSIYCTKSHWESAINNLPLRLKFLKPSSLGFEFLNLKTGVKCHSFRSPAIFWLNHTHIQRWNTPKPAPMLSVAGVEDKKMNAKKSPSLVSAKLALKGIAPICCCHGSNDILKPSNWQDGLLFSLAMT